MLTEANLRFAKPRDSAYKLYDERSMYVLVTPSGGKLYRLKYRFDNKEKTLALGQYPDVALKKAREDRDDARRQIAAGIDPLAKRRSEQAAKEDTFEAIALELFTVLRKASGATDSSATPEQVEAATHRTGRKKRPHQRVPISADTVDTMQRRLTMHVFPHVQGRHIKSIDSAELLTILRKVEARGTFELAHRLLSICSRVWRYAKVTKRAIDNPAEDLEGALVPVTPEHMATITEPAKIGELLRATDVYHGDIITKFALQLAPLVIVRPIEFRHATWDQFQLDGPQPEWRIPWRRMKMRDPHIVPLSRQAVEILRELRKHTGHKQWVFPQTHKKKDRPISENCLTSALRHMGFSGEEMTWHGYKGLASTQLNEQGWNDKWIETQLAHLDRNKVRKAYNHAKYLPQRRVMMQAWADYLDALRTGKRIAFKIEIPAKFYEEVPAEMPRHAEIRPATHA